MNKYLLIIGILVTSLFSQIGDIQYDRSGQYGVITNNNRLMWNQDWTIGVLLIDGTFSNYPTRFGASYKNIFKVLDTSNFYQSLQSFPDSSLIKSRIDYYRGDFSYDQLEIDAEFAKKNHVISLTGFKRTYSGPYGQYADPQGGSNPLQQSYRLDYSSKDKDEILDLSIGHFITDSRLNLDDPADFIHKEKTIAIGIGYSKDFANWRYNAHGALFQQYYKMSFDSAEVYLNRTHLNQFVRKKLNKSSLVKLGLEFDNQGISLVDTTKKDRYWSTLYGGWEKESIRIKFGTTIAHDEAVPYFNITAYSNDESTFRWQSYLRYQAVPKHIFLWNETDENVFEEWLTVHADIQINWKSIPLNMGIDYFYNQNTTLVHKYYINNELIDISNNLLSSSISAQLPIFREWKIDVQYRHAFEHNIYSDGIGDKAQIGMTVTEKLFKNNLLAQIRLSSEAYLNRYQNIGYEGFHYGPYITDDINLVLPDYWVFNLELSAKISNMTILWKVNNILQTVESVTTNQTFPSINKDYLLIANSNNFPPMSRFVTVNIVWNFEE